MTTNNPELDEVQLDALNLDMLAPLLGAAYQQWKTSEALKNKCKDRFFALANEALASKGLAFTMVEYPANDEADARERVLLHHPGWMIQELRPHVVKPGLWQAVIIEDPAYKPFSYEHGGVKYARQVSKGTVMVDDDWLRDENPELWETVTHELPWGEHVIKPMTLLDAETIGALTKYIYNSAPRASLAAPRPVKEET